MNLRFLYSGPNVPTIGLYGIGGVYNYGTEAIVRGTEIILRKTWPDVRIIYASPRPEDDKRRLKGSNVEIVERRIYPRWTLPRILNMAGIVLGSPWRPFVEDLTWINDCDVIFSIGGDIYTLPANYKEKYTRSFYYSLIHFGNIVKNRGKKLIIWGASIGPFEGYPKAKKAFTNHLQSVDLITSREPITTSYLHSLGIQNNVVNCADPAFIIPSPEIKKTRDDHNLCIGINFSPLSSLYVTGDIYNKTILKEQVQFISYLVTELKAKVILIPHVICSFNVIDDDLRYLQALKMELPKTVSDNVQLIEQDLGFIGTKQVLANCDVILASRMHCAINALATKIPTILISYSQKSYGMANYIYGNEKWVLPLKNLTANKLINLTESLLSHKISLCKYLTKRLPDIKLDTIKPMEKVIDIINN